MISARDLKNIRRYQGECAERRKLMRCEFDRNTHDTVRQFCHSDMPFDTRLDNLVAYLAEANLHYSVLGSTRAYYPGLPSIYGATNDAIEGISRLMPLWAVLINDSSASESLVMPMKEHLRKSLLNGTNPAHEGYWGTISDKSTLICEAADIALALWLSRDSLWREFNDEQKNRVLSWLKQVPYKSTADNNWHIFVALVGLVISDLDPAYVSDAPERMDRIKSFYLGNGCFKDGPDGHVDLYNPWGFHYALYWIEKINPGNDGEWIRQALCQYSEWFQYMFTSKGVPLFGRSLCYKGALPVPIIAASEYQPERFSPGMVQSVIDTLWRNFLPGGGLVKGRLSQGIFADDIRWLDPYSGPASPFWATRSLVMYMFLRGKGHFSDCAPLPLPAETNAVVLDIEEAGMRLTTQPEKHLAQVFFTSFSNDYSKALISTMSFKDKVKQLIWGVAHRPANNLLKSGVALYDSELSYYRPEAKNG